MNRTSGMLKQTALFAIKLDKNHRHNAIRAARRLF